MTNEETIFAEALSKGSEEQQAAYLESACAGDAGLRRDVDALLIAHRAAGILEAPLAGVNVTKLAPASTAGVGSTVGPYKLLEQIGGGGMGVVYMAEQLHPVRRKVALKIIRPGMDSGQVIARFEVERQALAMMDHTNIAKVLDAGTTDAGRPYFVMELVKGIPITDYCDQARLTTRQRLELFIQVCQAVQHAHQKGVIHRDLKPTNILVTLHDGKAVPKVIDFGIAKAAGQLLTEKTLFTNYAQMLGTPLYMSPEQAQLSGLDVDTRSDVYSLGVLLYELLTGTTPFAKQRLREAAYDEMRRIIREEEPPKPSTRLSTLGGQIAAISDHRDTDPKRLNHLVRGELDWIVMKSLEKDRTRRYETANELARDVERHLRDEPVQACPPSRAYRVRKFARRNKVALTTAALISAALLLGTAMSTWQAIRANRNLVEANRQRNLAEAGLKETRIQKAIAEKNQDLADKSHQQARRAVEQLFVIVGDDLVLNQPEFQPLRAELLQAALGYYQEFIKLWKDVPAKRAELAISYRRVAQLAQQMGAQAEALSAGSKALELQIELANEQQDDSRQTYELAITWIALGLAQQSSGQHNKAAQSYDQALVLWESLAEKDPLDLRYQSGLAAAYHNLGYLRSELNQRDEAVGFLKQALAIRERLVKEHPDSFQFKLLLAGTCATFGNGLREARQWDEALVFHYRSLTLLRELVQKPGARSDLDRLIGAALNRIVDVHRSNRRQQDWAKKAMAAYAEARTLQERLVREHPTFIEVQSNLANTLMNIGQVYRAQKNYAEALTTFDTAIALLDRLVRVNPHGVSDLSAMGTTYSEKARVLASQNQPEDAVVAYQRAIESHEKVVRLAPLVTRFQSELAGFRQELAHVQKQE